MADNRHDYASQIESNFIEMIRWDWAKFSEGDFSDADRDAWTAEYVLEEYDYNGRFHEMVDGLIPIYTTDVVKLWLDLGMPEAEDWGNEVSEMDIIQQMKVGIFCWTEDYARRHFVTYHEVVTATAQKVGN